MIATELARFAHGLRYSAIPADVVAKAKTCILDILGVSVGGYGSANAKVALKGAAALGAPGKARVWMNGARMRAVDAVPAASATGAADRRPARLVLRHLGRLRPAEPCGGRVRVDGQSVGPTWALTLRSQAGR